MSAAVETGLFLDGLHCSSCVNRVERALRAAPGVVEAAVNYTTHRALVRFDPESTNPECLVGEVEALGYAATPYSPEALEGPHQRDARAAQTRLLVAAFLAGNVMVAAAALYIGETQGLDVAIRTGLRWLAIALSLPAVTWCALPFWKGAWTGIRRREITIDLPIVLGISTAFATNIAGTLAEAEHLYVDSAAMIVFLILLGRTLERSARARASSAIDRLTSLTPATAQRRCADGSLETVPAASLLPGDRVLVAPGEVVPGDADIIAGASEFDESLLSGESLPVVHRVGEPVTGGTLNLLAEVEIAITAAVDSGTLARLAALLERAQTERPEIQRLADRVARIFAPTVLGLAAATALGWALSGAAAIDVALAASAVLIVACPCALGLATPAAVTAAIGRAAKLGVLVKGGESLERCARVDACVLDKTGTLTVGQLAVAGVTAASSADPESVLRAAAWAEGASKHPIAKAIALEAERRNCGTLPPAAEELAIERRTEAGAGVEATQGGFSVRVGTRSFAAADGGTPADVEAAAREQAKAGASLAWVSENGKMLGVVSFVDRPRPDAGDALRRLKELGVQVELVTGDHEGAALAAAKESDLPPEHVYSDVAPEGKVEHVLRWRSAGHSVVTVGDGINDAAALASADVGAAMASGSDVAMHAADLVIRSPRLGAVPDSIELARETLKRIRENLSLAVAYNILAVPLAAAGLLSPLAAAAAMSVSSLLVTGNAIRLASWKPRT